MKIVSLTHSSGVCPPGRLIAIIEALWQRREYYGEHDCSLTIYCADCPFNELRSQETQREEVESERD